MTEYRITFKKERLDVEYTVLFVTPQRKLGKKVGKLERALFEAVRIEELGKNMKGKYKLIKVEELPKIPTVIKEKK